MSTQRPERVQEALRQEISRIVHQELRDPRLGFITITGVELTRDLRYAKVFFSVLGEAKDKKRALHALNSAKGYMKNLISDRIKLRFMPEISFRIDDTLEHAGQLDVIFNKIEKEKKEREKKEKADEEGNSGDKEV